LEDYLGANWAKIRWDFTLMKRITEEETICKNTLACVPMPRCRYLMATLWCYSVTHHSCTKSIDMIRTSFMWQVTVDTMLLESNSTAKAILELIPVLNIRHLVMGTKRLPRSRYRFLFSKQPPVTYFLCFLRFEQSRRTEKVASL